MRDDVGARCVHCVLGDEIRTRLRRRRSAHCTSIRGDRARTPSHGRAARRCVDGHPAVSEGLAASAAWVCRSAGTRAVILACRAGSPRSHRSRPQPCPHRRRARCRRTSKPALNGSNSGARSRPASPSSKKWPRTNSCFAGTCGSSVSAGEDLEIEGSRAGDLRLADLGQCDPERHAPAAPSGRRRRDRWRPPPPLR